MNTISVGFSPLNRESALAAGEVWRRYRVHGGPRARVIPDFLIGAHAALQCERLLSRDRGFYREYFKRLRLLDPTGGD
jgi:predicted nucleic acid-binding protein